MPPSFAMRRPRSSDHSTCAIPAFIPLPAPFFSPSLPFSSHTRLTTRMPWTCCKPSPPDQPPSDKPPPLSPSSSPSSSSEPLSSSSSEPEPEPKSVPESAPTLSPTPPSRFRFRARQRPPPPAPPPGKRPRARSLQRPAELDIFNEEDWLVRSRIRRSAATSEGTKIAVCGGGSFGTAMANVLARNGYPVSLLVRKPWVRDEINLEHRNPKYLSEFILPENLTATISPDEAFADAKLCVHAVPVQATRDFVMGIRSHYPPDLPVLCTSKGLEISSLSLMCDVLPDLLHHDRKYAYLSGPSFAQEIMQGLPTAVVVASADHMFANSLADMFSSPSFKVFTSTDTVGLEVAGAIKNVIAIAAGMSEGLGLGTNSMAALVTRGCSEMRRIALAHGASPVTLAGLSGVGDTFLTCFGPLSRNRTVGVRLGRGEKLEDILSTSRQIAEGVATSRALVKWLGGGEENSPAYIRASLKYPILYGVAAILDGRITPREGLHMLLAMPPRPED